LGSLIDRAKWAGMMAIEMMVESDRAIDEEENLELTVRWSVDGVERWWFGCRS
jgi:acetolactate synthase regulatory subunit